MWSDNNSEGSCGPSHQHNSGDGSSSYAATPQTNPTTIYHCDPSMDLDEHLVGASQNRDLPAAGFVGSTSQNVHHSFGDYMSDVDDNNNDDDDDDDDLSGGGAPIDILSITNVLSHGLMGLDDDDLETASTGTADLDQGNSEHSVMPNQIFEHPPSPPLPPLHGSIPQVPISYQHPLLLPHMASVAQHPQHLASTIQQTVSQDPPQDEEQTNNPNDHHVQILHHPQAIHNNAFSNSATALGPENYNLTDFIRVWSWQTGTWQGLPRERGRYPWPERIVQQLSQNVSHVDYADLEGDRCDVQGLDWEDLGVTRSEARERRLNTYKNYVNIPNSDRWQVTHDMLPCTENFFRFRRLDVRKNINLAHFQLRNVLASTSRSQVFYPGQTAVQEYNPITGKGKVGMKSHEVPHLQVSTLSADQDTLVAGGFFGEYCFRRLSSDYGTEVHEGTITSDNSGITNHVQLHPSRTAGPRAAFASNDRGFRVLDIESDRFISETYYRQPVNCSAISPDRRLRVIVGDQTQVLITKADADGQPEILQKLNGHGDYGFACDWADDGWTVATGFQDKSIKIWDARHWTDSSGRASPVCTLGSEIAGVRTLRFSPLGSGRRVLVAGEEADYVNIYDARTFKSKQTFDFFGEIGGISFANEGQDLHVLCCDRARGGLFQLERCGVGAERNWDPDSISMGPGVRKGNNHSYDWQEFSTTPRRLPRYSETRKKRRVTALHSLDPF